MIEISLPRLVGTRGLAAEIVAEAFEDHADEQIVTVFARAVLNAAPSFIDAFVEKLKDAGVREIVVVGGEHDFLGKIQEVCARRGGIVARSSKDQLASA